MARQAGNNGASLGFEVRFWAAADKLRGNMEPSDCERAALGLIFLKYIPDAFEAKRTALLEEDLADAEDPEGYLAENVFWPPNEERWLHLQAESGQPTVGKEIDDAMPAIETGDASLQSVLSKEYAHPPLNKVRLSELSEDKMKQLVTQLRGQQAEAAKLDVATSKSLGKLGWWSGKA